MLCLCLVIAASASAQDRLLTTHLGMGIDYGGYGAKVTFQGNSRFGLTAGLGYYSGPPLIGWGGELDSGEIEFNSKNMRGLGYSIGVDFWWSGCIYSSLQFVGTGNYYSHDGSHSPLSGLNWTVIGTQIGLGQGFFLDLSGNCAWPFTKTEMSAGILGLSVGVGCMFGL